MTLGAGSLGAQVDSTTPPVVKPPPPPAPVPRPVARPPVPVRPVVPPAAKPARAPTAAAPAAARPVPSRVFVGHAGPAGSTEVRTKTGIVARTAADGSLLDALDARHGVSVHRGLDGGRSVVAERPGHVQVVSESSGAQYVAHPYVYHGRPFYRRSYVVDGRVLDRFYRHYALPGYQLDVYAPAQYYSPALYAWAMAPWSKSVPYNWRSTNSPSSSYYSSYFTPSPSYSSPAAWLTDYVIAASLKSAYSAKPANAAAETAAATPLAPETKQLVANEVARQTQQNSLDAAVTAQKKDVAPAVGGIAQVLSDKQPHVFVANSDLDLVDPSGRRCQISGGDVVQVASPLKPGSPTTDVVVLASKGGSECEPAANVEIALTDLQEMHNHMCETLDQGMAEIQTREGHAGLPQLPAGATSAPVAATFTATAPPPDANAVAEVGELNPAADEIEQAASAT